MPRIISKATRKEKKKKCSECKCTIGYFENEVIEEYNTDPWGFTDHYDYIRCPNCNERIVIKQY